MDQLGSDKAAVRLGGLYALDRLGENNPRLRWTVIDVICAYLRMPYIPPVVVLLRNADGSPARPLDEQAIPREVDEGRTQELEVRKTAQQLLASHLGLGSDEANRTDADPGPSSYWWNYPGKRMNLNLRGAVLVDFFLGHRHPDNVDMSGAQFHGEATMDGAEFHGDILLSGAQFHASVYLGKARFHGRALLAGVQFYGDAVLRGVQFHRDLDAEGAHFRGNADLRGARFYGGATFTGTHFASKPRLEGAKAALHTGTGPIAEAAHADYALPPGWFLGAESDESGFQWVEDNEKPVPGA